MTSDEGKIPNPVGTMLAGWPVLYSDATGAAQENVDGEAAKIREEVVRPLLDTGDLCQTFEENWKESLATTEAGLETVMTREDRFDNDLAAAFKEHEEVLGEQAAQGALEILRLRKIVRESVVPYRETWPGESWARIAHLMIGSELCLVGILEFITTGTGRKENVLILARRGFENPWTPTRTRGTTDSTPRGWRTSRSDRVDDCQGFDDTGPLPSPSPSVRMKGNTTTEMRTMETLTLNKAKETKNKIVYGTADGSVIQSVYIDRDALGDEPPEKVKVVISEG